MKLLQIDDIKYIETDKIAEIFEINNHSCWIRLDKSPLFMKCTLYSAIQIMSMILEENSYGNDGICKEDK